MRSQRPPSGNQHDSASRANGLIHHLFREDEWRTLPNFISSGRILLLPVFAFLLCGGELRAAAITLGVVFFTDFLDGFIARRMHAVSNLGRWLDPLADRLTISVAAPSLVISGLLPWPIMVALFLPDLLLGVFALLAFRGNPGVRVTPVGKWRTGLLFVGIALFLVGIAWAPEPVWAYDLLVQGGQAVFIAGLVGHYAASAHYAVTMVKRLRVLPTL
ncbi:CDP-alcohol phosphatidyltransferase family protein [Microbacterium sp. NPDC089695]|uniref:CDP-alcohol phosphatidyltransferase family protein n=1 Tax=Microbacterium sp. NPDC089695 TaxID=3364198 RepID=UPI00381C3F56